ncbi:YugN family protein [Paenibacillus hamazuiensis]|uniref:YugN family protein n=1 Tax=Paenibacillus hamazuiensis TaxID=2936508 RepID=UPI00200D7CA7|nr:YugN family protein [Paenibacillus hamazuiensis]
MEQLQSGLAGKEESFDAARDYLSGYGFTLGGNWTYENGCFDCSLDEAQKVWLRIPFQTTSGEVDGNAERTGATILLGQPFVLNHVYNEGLDAEAHGAGMLNQFQEPVDKDAPVGDEWVSKARQLLKEVEQNWLK